VLSSCSKIETGISLAPRLITNKIDDAFDFTSKKKSSIKTQVEADLTQSKKEIFKKFIRHLDQVDEMYLKKAPTDLLLTSFYDDLAETQTFIISNFKTTAEFTFKDLSVSEVENFKSFSDKKYAEELSLSKNKKKFVTSRTDSFVKFYEFFLDDLGEDQKRDCSDFVEKNIDYFALRIKTRQNFSEALHLKLLRKETALEFFITNYSGVKFADVKDLEQKKYLLDLFAFQRKFVTTFTSKQKEHLLNKITDIKSDLLKLSL
jgi:hypothetical protein